MPTLSTSKNAAIASNIADPNGWLRLSKSNDRTVKANCQGATVLRVTDDFVQRLEDAMICRR
jgi:hypothetical protein